MKPNPNAMPIKPIRFDRCSGDVMSAMYACATVILAPQRPANTREAMIIHSAVAPVSRVASANQA
jgi:hypothetical protein